MSLVIQEKELSVARFDALMGEELESAIRELHADSDPVPIRGTAHAVLRNGDGEIKSEALMKNLITRLGNEYYGERAANISSPPDQVSGMQLGTGSTAVAAFGAGSFIVTHVAGSNVAITGGYPQSQNPSAGVRRIIWLSSWAAGVATNAALTEAALINTNPLGSAAAVELTTVARIILNPTINKGASDTLDLTLNHDIGS